MKANMNLSVARLLYVFTAMKFAAGREVLPAQQKEPWEVG